MIRILPLALALLLALPAQIHADPAADSAKELRAAQLLANAGQWEAAVSAAPAGIGRDVILWQKLRSGEGLLGEYEDFLKRRSDWPGLPLLKEKGEIAAARSQTPARVIAYFGKDAPRTAAGAIALVGALLAQGDTPNAETEVMRAWADLKFTIEEEQVFLTLMPQAAAAADHLRLENLLWAGRRVEAERMLPRLSADQQKLARARIALRAEAAGVDTLVAAVPKALQRDPGLLYERFVFRMRKDLYDGAAELLLSVPADGLGRPEAWADRRALLTRWLLRQGRPKEAYRAAAAHGLSRGSSYADLEFLAGFIALRQLNDPATAARHFAHLKSEVSTPISLARAAYWQARAEEAQGKSAEADAHYRLAARHQTAYYGLLAAERLGLSLDPALLDDSRPADWRQSGFAGSSVLQAAQLLLASGDRLQAKRFLLHLAESLDAGELAQLADMALSMDEPHLAVVIAKAAAERGAIIPRAYYPVPAMVPDGLKVSRALALAISRRESEFDPAARSHADARGLMQVLPGTAKLVARDLGIEFDAGKLIGDPAFNVTVGSAYLARMVEEFGPSIALVASGYNAGPGRPRRWITELGDPRSPDTDIVDWVETIPFGETRTYVMRVVEGVVIYRAKLRGSVGPVRVSAELKG